MRKTISLLTLFAICTLISLKSLATAPISGPSSVCTGATITLTDSTVGGSWSSGSPSVATITSGGIVSGLTAGSAVISYTTGGSTGTSIVTKTVTVNLSPSAITSSTTIICVGGTTTFYDSTAGGTWSLGGSTIATLSTTSGTSVTLGGISTGSAYLSYTLSTGCTTEVYVGGSAATTAGTISGSSTICVGGTGSLSSTTGGGRWTSGSTSVATVSAVTGGLTGVSAGTAEITYTVTTICGTAITTFSVTVAAGSTPEAGTISGSATVCPGSHDTLIDAGGTTGGTWTSGTTSVATITSAGIVTGVSAGTSVITYSVSSSCATVSATFTVTVGTGTSAGTISGASTVCTGTTATLTDGSTGGEWRSSSTSIATVDSSTGIVYPVSAGTVTISYVVSGSCGSASATHPMTVALGAGYVTVSGTDTLCVGSTLTMHDSDGATSGGRWTAGPGSVATISGSGVVYGVGIGTATVTYAVAGGGCYGGAFKTVYVITTPAAPRPISGLSIVCTGSTITLLDSTSGGTWSSRHTSLATVTSDGVVTGVSSGADTIVYSMTNMCGSSVAVKAVAVANPPATGTISGASSVCVGTTTSLTDTATGGAWHSSNTSIATVSSGGVVGGVAGGIDTIFYSISASCGSASAVKLITVIPHTVVPMIEGSSSVCIGTSTTLSDSITTGTWSSSNSSVASINSSTGAMRGVSVGSATITYTVTGSCGTAYAILPVTVVATPTAGTISGLSAVCTSSTITLTDTTSSGGSGTWSSSSSSVASVNSSGVVRGSGVGSAVISYTVSTSCGTVYATRTVIVTTSAFAGTVSGPSTVCAGSTISFVDTTGTGTGTWSTSNTSIATVNSSGVLYGVASGTINISYTVSGSCGTASAIQSVTVTSASAGAITGASTVCVGATISLADGTSGGTWVTGNSSIASVNSSGTVTGVSAGTVYISYNVTNSCGTASATKLITVATAPATPAAISGPSSVCTGASITLTDTTSGGAWSSSNTTLASVNTSGVVTGSNVGTDTIIYVVTNTCGSSLTRKVITINTVPPTPSAISGTTSVCTGASTTLTDGTSGGSWSSSNTSIASLSGVGMVNGITAGSVTISYTVTNVCGSTSVTTSFTVNPAPTAGTISGASTVCAGANTTFTDGVSGGSWSSSNTSVATVTSSGVVFGVSAGSATIVYTVTGICGTATSTRSISVSPAPAVAGITGTSVICPGDTTTYRDSTSGGVWSSTNTTIASVSSTGLVTGIASGTSVISYSFTNSCGVVAATKTITVSPGATAGSITGPTSLCTGSTVDLTDAVTGGTWTSSSTSIATVSSSGVVSGVAIGTVTISYSVTNSCGSAITAAVVSVGGLPSAGSISGPTALCSGTTITLTSSATGGSWSSSNTAVATITSGGVLTGVSGGTVTVSYYVSSSCATAITTTSVVVSPSGTAGSLSGLATVCPGATITLTTSGASGGTWISSNPARATVNSTTGVITGVTIGALTITYSISNSCGTTSATKTITVNPLPSVSALTGPSSVCAGSTITLTDTVTGTGTSWLSSNVAVATVSASGVVSGVAIGTATITYYLTNSCGTARTTHAVTVNTLSAGAISGPSTVAVGSLITLTSTITGGTWSSATTSLATVNTTGVVTGVAVGNDSIIYSVTNSCGTATVKHGVSVTAHRDEPIAGGANTTVETDNINLYPNPSTGTFVVDMPGANGNAIILITDISGRVVLQKTSDEKSVSIDLSSASAGTYIVMINVDNKNYYKKVIVQ